MRLKWINTFNLVLAIAYQGTLFYYYYIILIIEVFVNLEDIIITDFLIVWNWNLLEEIILLSIQS